MSQVTSNITSSIPIPSSPKKEINTPREKEDSFSPIKNVAKAIKTEQVS